LAQGAQHKQPVRIVIVGGGCAGIAAAWELAREPGYEIHVFEKSWRLGGKGASGRASDGRILEHGLHLWLGCYENAFRMMRECYREVEKRNWGPHARTRNGRLVHGRMDDAFLAEPHVGVGGLGHGREAVWSGFFPPAKGLPGEPLDTDTNPFTLASYLLRCLGLLKTLMQSVIGTPEDDIPGMPRPDRRSRMDEAVDLSFSLDTATAAPIMIERMADLLRAGALTGFAALLQAVTMLEKWLEQTKMISRASDTAIDLMEAVAAQVRKLLSDVVAVDGDIRTKTEIIDIILAIAVGLFRDRVLFDDRGLDAINETDYRDWLRQHGASKSAIESRFLTGIYDFVFAYQDGNKKTPGLAAGVALRGALRMFLTYRGSMFWRVRSGMGDTVFAPLYKVLMEPERLATGGEGQPQPASPVHFHFLHELQQVGFKAGPDGAKYVSSLHFRKMGSKTLQDALNGNALDEFGCWPSGIGENVDEIAEVDVWNVGEKFDGVILATGIDDFKLICKAAISGRRQFLPRHWKRMCDEVKTVSTQSAQVWLSKDTLELGWYRGAGVVTALGNSFDTWADMTHTLPSEQAWRDRRGGTHELDDARSVAYFCSPLSETEITRSRNRRDALDHSVARDLEQLLKQGMKPYWPNAYETGQNAKSIVMSTHVQANFTGSDRYTLSLPGTVRYRISPLDGSVANMTIAGDWTACGFDAGCVESAVMSGMLAAFAISGKPDPETIIGYDHP
jgi:uncharacterized protein with NAD-binding domain and iron-sulfur cluster